MSDLIQDIHEIKFITQKEWQEMLQLLQNYIVSIKCYICDDFDDVT
jgi:hypothetical protein